MAVTTNRIIQVNITSDPTAALAGTKMSIYNGMLKQAQNVKMDAGIVGTATVMQAGDKVDLDNNGTYESTYASRFNFPNSTFTLANGTTITGAVNFIKVTTGSVAKYFLIIPDSIAALLDGNNITSINPGGALTATPNTAGDNFNDAASFVLTCFAAQTRILTDRGERVIGNLKKGDRVWLKDQGFVAARWIGMRCVDWRGRFAPIRFAPGVIGNHSALRVSPQHRIHVDGPQIELLFGTAAALVAAQHLLGLPGVTAEPCDDIIYVHVMFDSHGVVLPEGALSESFFPGDYALAGQDNATRAELLTLFPELASERKSFAQTCLPCLTRAEARLLNLAAVTCSGQSEICDSRLQAA